MDIPNGVGVAAVLAWGACAVFLGAVLWAAWCDLRSFTIPNRLSLLIVAAFAVYALAMGLEWQAVALHLGVSIGLFLLGWGLFALRLCGGGDVKLLSAVALWAGANVGAVVLGVVLSGGVLAALLLLVRGLSPHLPLPPALVSLATGGRGMPYGVAIALGTGFFFIFSVFGQTI